MAQSITLQTSDSDIVSSDVLGRLSFAASSESSGSDAVLIGASIYAMAESNFTEISNATSIIFATASSESAIAKLKISSQGHFLPILDKTYDIGASGTKFRNVFAENGKFENISISNLSDPYEILYITDSSGNVSSTDLLKVDLTNSELDLNADIVGTGNISISGNIIANTGSYNALTVNSISVSVSGHTHTASDITNFNEAVDDRIGSGLMIEGTGVNLTYNDTLGTLTIDNLHTEINILSQEPQGFVNTNDSLLSFNDSTRTFTIQPATSGGFYDVYIKGIKVSKTGVDSVVIGSGTALNYLHFDTNPPYSLQNKTTTFNFDTDVPIAYIHWNADINQSTFFGEERHGIRMDSVTHKWIHNTFGIQYINGLSIGGYTLGGNGSSNSHAQIDISDGILYQEDIIINITNGTGVGDFIQQLSPIAYIPTYYHSGSTGQWVRDIATTFPLKYNATRAQYNLYSPGPPPNWTTPNVGDKKYFAMWIVATNDINEPILAIVGQREDSNIGAAQSNNTWSDINLTNIPASEIRPLYRLIFLTDNTFTNTPKSSLQSILDLRVIIQSTNIGVTQNDHGALFGLADDDHLQYVHINENRTISAAHTFSNGLYSSGLITSVSGNFTQNLQLNGTTVSVSGHTHTSSDITNFNSSVSGLLPVTNVTAGSGISVSASSGNYTINIDVIDCGQVLAPPNAPTNLSIIASNASLALSWTAPTYAGSTAITGHIVEYTPSGGSASTVNTNSTSTSYTLSGLTNGTSYSIRVRAINSIGNGSYSNAVSGTPAQANLLSLNSYYWRHYNNSPSTDPMGTSFSGAGTSGNSAIAIIGTNYNTIGTNYYGDARMWISVVTGGTLSYTLTYKNTGGYNGGALLYKTSTSPSQHNQSLQDAITNFTIINSASNSDSAGTITTKTGTVSVNTGDYIVLRWYQDDGGTLIPESKVVMSITP